MLFQRVPLPPDVEYFLDCANEADEIGSFAHAVLNLLGNRKAVMAIVDTEGKSGRSRRNRWEKCSELDTYAHEIVADLAPHEQRAFVAAGLRWEPLHLLRIAEYLSYFNFEDQTRGGANLPFRRQWRCDDNYDPTPRARRRLYSPAAIRRYARLEGQAIPMSRAFAARLRRLPAAVPADMDLITALQEEQRQAFREEHFAARRRFEEDQKRKWRTWDGITDRPDRRAVTRAAQFCAGLIGADKVGAFARGQAVAFPAGNVIIEIARNRSISTIGHGALDVRLCAADGTRLANLCVYFEKTPAIDQLAAIAMHVGAGDEGAIIQTGNLFNITKAGAEHPIVRERLGLKLAPPLDNRAGGAPRRQTDHSRQLEAARRYQAATITIYVEAVRTQVWGRDANRLNPFIDDLMNAAVGDILEMGMANAA